MRILLIEDDPMIGTILSDFFVIATDTTHDKQRRLTETRHPTTSR